MPYLNVDLDYFTHPKVVRLIGLIGPQHVAAPIRLWAYVGKHHCENGALVGYSQQEIESILAWKGKRGELVDALVRVGFLECVEPDSYRVHDWLEHAGHLAAFKKRAKASAEKRWNSIAGKHATSIQDSIRNVEFSNAPNHLILPNLPNHLNQPDLASPALGITAPPNRKCARHTKEGPCQEYAMPGSRYCMTDREYFRTVRERKAQEATS